MTAALLVEMSKNPKRAYKTSTVKLWCTGTINYSLAIKISYCTFNTFMNLKYIRVDGKSQSQKVTHCVVLLMQRFQPDKIIEEESISGCQS